MLTRRIILFFLTLLEFYLIPKNMDYRELMHLGLAEKEAKVYLTSLELGKSTVQKIAEKSNVNRATTYVIIETLLKKGLMSSYTEGKKQFFFAESPDKLSFLFREEVMAIQRKQEYLDTMMSELKSLQAADKDKPIVRYYEGKVGVRNMLSSYFKGGKDEESQLVYSDDLREEAAIREDLVDLKKKRVDKKIKTKVIYNKENDEVKIELGEGEKVSGAKYPFEAEIMIYGSQVRFLTMKKNLRGIIIENDEVATTLKSLFRLAWKGLIK